MYYYGELRTDLVKWIHTYVSIKLFKGHYLSRYTTATSATFNPLQLTPGSNHVFDHGARRCQRSSPIPRLADHPIQASYSGSRHMRQAQSMQCSALTPGNGWYYNVPRDLRTGGPCTLLNGYQTPKTGFFFLIFFLIFILYTNVSIDYGNKTGFWGMLKRCLSLCIVVRHEIKLHRGPVGPRFFWSFGPLVLRSNNCWSFGLLGLELSSTSCRLALMYKVGTRLTIISSSSLITNFDIPRCTLLTTRTSLN